MEWMNNALGRKIPADIEGKTCAPFQGAFADSREEASTAFPQGARRASPPRQKPDKRVAGWDALFDRLAIQNGAKISFHHHLRNGDRIVNEVVARLAARGVRDLTIVPTALFPVHDALLPYIREGSYEDRGLVNGAIAPPVRGRSSALCASLPRRPPEGIQEGTSRSCPFIAAPTRTPTHANGSPPFGCGPSDREA